MTSPPPDARAGQRRRHLVLIVDDNERNRKLARDVLRAAGFATLEAATGAESIVLADTERPDVVLLDLVLPDMDGVDVLRELRSRRRTARLPVVALSARLGIDPEWASAVGFSGCIAKPIRVADFPGQVRDFCRLVET